MVEETGTFEVSEAFSLLDEALFALENIPEQSIPDGSGGSTIKLASKIKALLEGGEK